MRKQVFGTIVALGGLLSLSAMAGEAFDVKNVATYNAAHKTLVSALRRSISDTRELNNALARVRGRSGEIGLAEICSDCTHLANTLSLGSEYEPSVWLYQPSSGRGHHSSFVDKNVLIAFPPSGRLKGSHPVEAVSLDGRWQTLDSLTPPSVPVFVVRINGKLSWANQVRSANELLRQAGVQTSVAPKQSFSTNGTGHWTTRLESIYLHNDEEPWISGAAEIYAVTSGVLPGNSAQVKIVDMPYVDYDGRTYFPRQIILDWQDYSYGVANIQLFEHDDNTNYRDLVTVLVTAIGAGGSLAGYPVAVAIAEIANRIVAAMPDSVFTNDEDYVDSIYSVEKEVGETNRLGAGGNAVVSYIPYELPAN